MDYMNKFTDVFAQRQAAEEAEERALIQKYEETGTEERLRQVRSADPEPKLPEPAIKSGYHRPWGQMPQQPISVWQRSPLENFSIDHIRTREPAVASPRSQAIRPDGLSEITGDGLIANEDERKDCQRQRKTTEKGILPLPRCSGLDRYRMAADADLDLVTGRLRRNLTDLPLAIVEELATTSLSETHSPAWEIVLREMRQAESRRNSSSSQPFEYSGFDPANGARVIKGFRPCTDPSLFISLQKDQTFNRRDTELNLRTVIGERNFHFSQPRSTKLVDHVPQQNLLIPPAICSRTPNMAGHKIERPCVFDDGSDYDSAVASLDDEEDWVDIRELTGGGKSASLLAKVIPKPKLSVPQVRHLDVQGRSCQTTTESGERETYEAPRSPLLVDRMVPGPTTSHTNSIGAGRQSIAMAKQDEKAVLQARTADVPQAYHELVAVLESNGVDSGALSIDHTSTNSGVCMATAVIVQKNETKCATDTSPAAAENRGLALTAKQTGESFEPRNRTRSNTVIRLPRTDSKLGGTSFGAAK